jgi:hypothetical protein
MKRREVTFPSLFLILEHFLLDHYVSRFCDPDTGCGVLICPGFLFPKKTKDISIFAESSLEY